MGDQPSIMTEEQNVAAGTEALAIFQLIDTDADEKVSLEDWQKVFPVLDTNENGNISRKEWYIKQGTTEMFDAINKKSSGSISHAEWSQGFLDLDTNSDGFVSRKEWLARKKVRLSFLSLGRGMFHWGVGVGDKFYEMVEPRESRTDIAVLGPNGVVALSESLEEKEPKGEWLLWAKAKVEEEGLRLPLTPSGQEYSRWAQERGEPRAHLQDQWPSFEQCGWTSKDESEVETWIQSWVKEHPSYLAISVNKAKEVNNQTFAMDLIRFLTGTEYWRITDSDKGKALVLGGTVVTGLALAGLAKSLVGAMSSKGVAAPEEKEEPAADSDKK